MKKVIILFLIILCTTSNVLAKQGIYEVHFLDTGQSDCILIKADTKNYLIDTGASYYTDKILKYLDSNGINNIDKIILTHYHDDHYGGLLKIAENKKVNTILMPSHNNEIKYDLYKQLIEKGIDVKYVSTGYTIKDKKMKLKIIEPIKENKKIENNNSLILQGEIDGVKYLFAGDCEKEEEKYMLKADRLKHCDVLKVPHHGLDTSTTKEFLKKLCPKVAIITCNGVETPDEKVINRINKYGIIVVRTDLQESIIIKNGILRMSKTGLTINLLKNV